MLRRYLDDPTLRPSVQTLETDNIVMGAFNLAQPPFDDPAVRRAVAYALDRRPFAAMAGPGFGFGDSIVASHYVNDVTEGGLTASWDPFPGSHGAPDMAAARRTMRGSRYAEGTSRCAAPQCKGVIVLVRDPFGRQEGAVRHVLAALGIEGTVRSSDDLYGECGRASNRAGFCIGDAWFPDVPSAGNTIFSVFGSQRLTGSDTPPLSQIGATPSQLRKKGWPVYDVPNVDDQIARCNEKPGAGQIPCWTRLDQYLVTQLMPAVPIARMRIIVLSSPAISAFAWDQATQAPALGDIPVAGH
jgi:hypothetical protein